MSDIKRVWKIRATDGKKVREYRKRVGMLTAWEDRQRVVDGLHRKGLCVGGIYASPEGELLKIQAYGDGPKDNRFLECYVDSPGLVGNDGRFLDVTYDPDRPAVFDGPLVRACEFEGYGKKR